MSSTPPSASPEQPIAASPLKRRATLDEWRALPEELRAELVDGEIVYKALPTLNHGRRQNRLGGVIGLAYDRRHGDAERPGGWWIGTEVDIELGEDGVRPDIAGWRRDRYPEEPKPVPGGKVKDKPDWICEVLSPSTAPWDLGKKLGAYHRHQVSHYWIVDPERTILTVYRWTPDGYLLAVAAAPPEPVFAEPFTAVALDLAFLFEE